MFDYIIGKIRLIDSGSVVLENNQIGYLIYCPSSTIVPLKLEDEVCLFTYFHVKEDGITLYGFMTREELKIFKLLISVSKIGPKIALSILSMMNSSQIVMAIKTQNANSFATVSGVGKKTADRIILELRDKVDSLYECQVSLPESSMEKSNVLQDTTDALLSLGYSQQEIQNALQSLTDQISEITVDELIKKALKILSRF